VALDDPGDRGLGGDRVLAGACCGAEGPQLPRLFLFSLLFFPAALIVAYMVSDRTAMAPA
jgi:hypothetical protein